MLRLIFYFFIISLLALVVVIGVKVAAQWFGNFQPGKSKVAKDVLAIKNKLRLFIDDLIPWKNDELNLLSFNQVNKKISKGVVKSGQGVITSIYHEPMIAWGFKRYVGGGDNAIIYATTSEHEFIFRIKNSGTSIRIDKNTTGELRDNGILYGQDSNRPIARINKGADPNVLPILVNDREVATLKHPDYVGETNQRAFELLGEMNDEEEAILLSLTILEMLESEVKFAKA